MERVERLVAHATCGAALDLRMARLIAWFKRMNLLDHYRCRNPEDRRPTVRLHTHHKKWRSEGGGDEGHNLCSLCYPCHLRGVHGRYITIVDHGAVIEWRYPGRRVLELVTVTR